MPPAGRIDPCRLDMGVSAKFNGPSGASNDAAALLIEFYGLEESLKIPFTEAVIPLALNDLEKDRSNRVLGENLQQDAAGGIAVDQHAAALQLAQRFDVSFDALVDAFIIG